MSKKKRSKNDEFIPLPAGFHDERPITIVHITVPNSERRREKSDND